MHADQINSLPKYVASSTLDEATWNATIIGGDVADEVSRLKQQPGSQDACCSWPDCCRSTRPPTT